MAGTNGDHPENAAPKRTLQWLCLGLVAAVMLAYAPAIGHGFVSWDDDTYVYDNSRVRQGLSWDSVKWAFGARHASNWHPLTWLSHLADVQIFGLNPGGHHAVSVLLHAANAVLLLLLLHALTGATWPSAWVAAIFALHPLRVESVAWIAERKDVLSGLFFMLTLLSYARYARRPGLARYLVVLVLFALGLLAKPMLVTLPFVLLLLDFWPLGRFAPTRAAIPDRRLLLEKLPLLALSCASSAITVLAQQAGGTVSSLELLPLSSRVANALVSYVVYLWQFLWPASLAFSYPHRARTLPEAIVPLACGAGLLLAAITVWAVRRFAVRPYVTVGWLWYVGTLVPVIGLLQVGMQAMADRYTYLPLIGIAIALVWSVHELVRGRPRAKIAASAVGAAVLVCWMVVAALQVRTWRDSRSLFEHALAVTSHNYVAHNNLGNVLLRDGKLGEAIAQYRQALRIRPDYPEALYNLGLAVERQGDTGGAIAHYERAIAANPSYAKACNSLGLALARQGKVDAAAAQYQRALAIDPRFAEAHNNLGVLLERRGDLERAAAHFEQSIRARSDYPEAHHNLGIVRQRQGRLGDAVAAFERALALRPDYAGAHVNLGVVLAMSGRMAEAASHFEQALSIEPGDARVRSLLARARAELSESPRP